jgi:hypothetical protein
MVVTVDQSRQNRHAGNVDDFGLVRPFAGGAGRHRRDPRAAHDDRGPRDRPRPTAVDQPASFEHLYGGHPRAPLQGYHDG